jgi:hypothetical protein
MARLTGRQGTLTLNGDAIADLFDWVAEWEVEWAPAPIKGEVFTTGSIGGFTGRVTARRFVNNANAASTNHLTLATQVIAQSTTGTGITSGVAAGEGPGATVTFVLDQLSGGGATMATLTGVGIVRRGSLNAPRDLANDTFEIEMTSIPVIT